MHIVSFVAQKETARKCKFIWWKIDVSFFFVTASMSFLFHTLSTIFRIFWHETCCFLGIMRLPNFHWMTFFRNFQKKAFFTASRPQKSVVFVINPSISAHKLALPLHFSMATRLLKSVKLSHFLEHHSFLSYSNPCNSSETHYLNCVL